MLVQKLDKHMNGKAQDGMWLKIKLILWRRFLETSLIKNEMENLKLIGLSLVK